MSATLGPESHDIESTSFTFSFSFLLNGTQTWQPHTVVDNALGHMTEKLLGKEPESLHEQLTSSLGTHLRLF